MKYFKPLVCVFPVDHIIGNIKNDTSLRRLDTTFFIILFLTTHLFFLYFVQKIFFPIQKKSSSITKCFFLQIHTYIIVNEYFEWEYNVEDSVSVAISTRTYRYVHACVMLNCLPLVRTGTANYLQGWLSVQPHVP